MNIRLLDCVLKKNNYFFLLEETEMGEQKEHRNTQVQLCGGH